MTEQISYNDFLMLQSDKIPEKFRIIYEILYTTGIDVEILLKLNCSQLISKDNNGYLIIPDNKLIKLNDNVFERLTKYLDKLNKPWGNNEAAFYRKGIDERLKLIENFLFESQKVGFCYLPTSFYKIFKRHAEELNLNSNLTLASFSSSSVARLIILKDNDILNKCKLSLIIIDNEQIKNIIRRWFLVENNLSIKSYRIEDLPHGTKMVYSFKNITLDFLFLLDYKLSRNEFLSVIKESDFGIYYYFHCSAKEANTCVTELLESYSVLLNENKKAGYYLVIDAKNLKDTNYNLIKDLISNNTDRNINYIMSFGWKGYEKYSLEDTLFNFFEEIFNFIE